MTWEVRDLTKDELLALPITELAISTRARNCLLNISMDLTIGELVKLTAFDLMMTPGLGRVSFAEIEGVLHNLRLELAEGPKFKASRKPRLHDLYYAKHG